MSEAQPRTGLNDAAYEHIKSMIMNLEMLPGERIPEEKIAASLGSSRTPVREAIRRLANDGLITIYPNRFAQVTQYDSAALGQIGALRLSFDVLSAQLAIRSATMTELDALKDVAQACYDAARSGNASQRVDYDCRFHLGIAEAAHNALLLKFQRELYLRIRLILKTMPAAEIIGDDTYMKQMANHLEILDLIARRDVRGVQNLICYHLQNFFNIEPAIIDNYMM